MFIAKRRDRGAERKLTIPKAQLAIALMFSGLFLISVIAIGFAVNRTEPIQENLAWTMQMVWIAMVAVLPVGFFVVRKMQIEALRQQARESGDEATLTENATQTFLRLRVMAAAMCEGAALFAAIICLATGEYVPMIGVVPAMALMLMQLPTSLQLSRFIMDVTGRSFR